MAVTYTKGKSGDTLQWQGNLTVDGTQVFTGGTSYAGDVTLGDAVADSAILKGRLATGTAAGTTLAIDATTYQYTSGSYLRYNVADWADAYTLGDFRAIFVRAETSEVNAAASLLGAEVYGVANNVGVLGLKGLLAYAYIKGATAKTVGTAYAVQAELTFDAGAAATTITTELTPFMSKITGGAADDYTKIHGAIIRAGDMDGASRTYGSGILIQDDSAMAGAITWTNGIKLENACTYGMLLTGATSFGVEITGSSTVAFDCRTGTFGTGISLAGTLTTAMFVGACGTGISIAGATTTGIAMTGIPVTGLAFGTSGTPLAMATYASAAMKVYTTYDSADAGNSVNSSTFNTVMTGAGGVGGRVLFRLQTAVALGGWANAVKAVVDWTTAGKVTGLGTVVNAEMVMPSTGVSGGTYAFYECEAVCPAGWTNASEVSLIYLNVTGDTAANFDTVGSLFDLNGLTTGENKMFFVGAPGADVASLRITVGGVPYYIKLASDQTL